MQALLCPLAPWLSLYLPRVHVIATGALIWGVATLAVGLATSYSQVAWLRGINGIGLALVFPPIQSLVADLASPTNRGMAFGWLQFMTYFGDILGKEDLYNEDASSSLLSADGQILPGSRADNCNPLSSPTHPLLQHSHATSPSSCTSPTSTSRSSASAREPAHQPVPTSHHSSKRALSFSTTPSSPHSSPHLSLPLTSPHPPPPSSPSFLSNLLHVLHTPSFLIIVSQGIVGSFAWASLTFLPMWLELVGFSHPSTALLLSSFTASCNQRRIGGGDVDGAAEGGSAGRPIFLGVFRSAGGDGVYDLVERRGIEQACFGFHPSSSSPTPPAAAPVPFPPASPATPPPLAPPAPSAADPGNARALSLGLFWTMALPFAVCCALYGGLYWTYPHDRDKARAEAAEEAR
ncbi:unnamed protein product [Closterium sp. NIES-54]